MKGGLDPNITRIVKACKQVIQSYEDYEQDTMTTPITVVQACEQLNCVIKKIKMDKKGYTEKFKNLGDYNPTAPVQPDDSGVIISGLHGLAGQILHNLHEHIKPTNQQQKTYKAIAYDEIDMWMKTTWCELAESFGLKIPKKEGQTVNPAPEHGAAL